MLVPDVCSAVKACRSVFEYISSSKSKKGRAYKAVLEGGSRVALSGVHLGNVSMI